MCPWSAGQLPISRPAKRPVLSFAHELDEDEGAVAFSLAESTKKRCGARDRTCQIAHIIPLLQMLMHLLHLQIRFQQERPLELGPHPSLSPQPAHSVFEDYASASRTSTLGQLSMAASHARGGCERSSSAGRVHMFHSYSAIGTGAQARGHTWRTGTPSYPTTCWRAPGACMHRMVCCAATPPSLTATMGQNRLSMHAPGADRGLRTPSSV
jgi:hypothetical protein